MRKNQIRKRRSKSKNRLPHSIDLQSPGPLLPRPQQSTSVSDFYFSLPISVIRRVSKAFLSDLSQRLNIWEQLTQPFKMQRLPNSHTAKSNSSVIRAQNANLPTIVNISNVPLRNSDNKLNN